MDGVGADAGVASTVAAEIVAAGGAAIADGSDVATADGGAGADRRGRRAFGRLDILVNNAGIIRWAGFPDADADNLASHLAVHVAGSFNTARAAWPHMVEQGYGRIVMTTSTGLFGLPENLSYATAKAAVIGLTRSLTVAGAAHGIKVNSSPRRPSPGWPAAADEADPRRRRRLTRCRRISWPRWSPSWPTRPARSAARSTPPAPAGSPASSSPRRGVRPPDAGADHRGRRRALGGHQRRDRVLRPGRPHGLVGRVHGAPGPERPGDAVASYQPIATDRSTRSSLDLSLSESERELVDLCRDFAQSEIAPRAPLAWEEARCPTDLLREMGAARPARHAHPGGVGRDRHVDHRLRRRHGADRPGGPVRGGGVAGPRDHRLVAAVPVRQRRPARALAATTGRGAVPGRLRAHRARRRLRRPRHPHAGRAA